MWLYVCMYEREREVTGAYGQSEKSFCVSVYVCLDWRTSPLSASVNVFTFSLSLSLSVRVSLSISVTGTRTDCGACALAIPLSSL
jgi:hypothetical protein